MIVELNKEYDEITTEMIHFANANNLKFVMVENKFKAMPCFPPITQQIAELKQRLLNTDYKTSKYVDGDYTEEEWQEIVKERKAMREHIRELEKEI